MKIFMPVIIGLLLFSSVTQAMENCTNASLQPGFQNSERQYEIHRGNGADLGDPRQSPQNVDSSTWLQRLARFELPILHAVADAGNAHTNECNYDTAIEVLDELEGELGVSNPYLKFWAENQRRVLESCAGGRRIPLIELTDEAKMVPRATHDLAYQKASILFYTRSEGDYSALEKAFLEQTSQHNSPMQGRAATMALRMARLAGGLGHMVDVATALRTDPNTSKAYAYAEDTVFAAYWSYDAKRPNTTEDITKRLQWLVNIALEKNIPVFSQNTRIQQSFREWRRSDAYYQLSRVINPGRLSDPDIQPGWWYGDSIQESPYMESVRLVAHTEPYIDFLATRFVQTPLKSWRWALYDPDSMIWRNSRIVAHHALNRFCAGDGVEWLHEAARLMPPADPEIAWTRDRLMRVLDDEDLRKRQPLLRGSMYQQAVRLSLMLKDDDTAYEVFSRSDINYIGDTGPREHAQPSYDRRNSPEAQLATLRGQVARETLNWYAHQGLWDQVRKFLGICSDNQVCLTSTYNRGLDVRPYKRMLADSFANVIASLSYTADFQANEFSILLDLIPTVRLLEIVEKIPFYPGDRQSLGKLLVPRLLMRSWVLGDEATFRQAAQIYARYFPEQKSETLNLVEGDSFARALFALRHQNNPYSDNILYSLVDRDRTETLRNWSGPWCQFIEDDYKSAIANLWEYAPEGAPSTRSGWGWGGDRAGLKYDPKLFAAARQAAILTHPLLQMSDPAELKRLASVAPGAQYLSSIIVSYAKWPNIWHRLQGRLQDMPEALHLAVRTGRFGCHRNGSDFGEISRSAYRILHKDFSDGVWTGMTPYWYK